MDGIAPTYGDLLDPTRRQSRQIRGPQRRHRGILGGDLLPAGALLQVLAGIPSLRPLRPLADLIAPHARTLDCVDPHLTLEGLRIVWARNA